MRPGSRAKSASFDPLVLAVDDDPVDHPNAEGEDRQIPEGMVFAHRQQSASIAPMVPATTPITRPYGFPDISEKPPVSSMRPTMIRNQPNACRFVKMYLVSFT